MKLISYQALLKRSFSLANKKIPSFLGALLLILAIAATYFILVIGVGAAITFWLYKFIPVGTQEFLYVILFILLLYILFKLNAAIAYLYAAASMEITSIKALAIKAWSNGLGFFFNTFSTGMLLFAGQSLAICPCFLLQTNFVFSPYLYLYENLSNRKARERSQEITEGFGWLILQRTSWYLLIGYIVLFLLLISLLTPWKVFVFGPWLFIGLLLLSSYISLVQSQFIREIYLETLEIYNGGESAISELNQKHKKKWPIIAILIILFAVILYYGVKFSLILLARR